RIGMVAIEVLELLGRIGVGLVVEETFSEGVHLGRRVWIERLGRFVVGRSTAGKDSARERAQEGMGRPSRRPPTPCTRSARLREPCHAPSAPVLAVPSCMLPVVVSAFPPAFAPAFLCRSSAPGGPPRATQPHAIDAPACGSRASPQTL